MDHPRGVEPPPRNVQRCYAHVNVEKGDRAPSTRTSTSSKNTEKHLATLELKEEVEEFRDHGGARESDQQASSDNTKLVR
jgi:hypothetical protein